MKLDEVFNNKTPSIKFPVLFEAAKVGREYDHLENLLIIKGSAGGVEALNELKAITQNPANNVNMKWDGIAAVFWGRDDQGNFVFLPQAQWNKAQRLDKNSLASEIENTGKPMSGQSGDEFSQTRKTMAARYKKLWDLFEKATPVNFRGYLNGDIMFTDPQQIKSSGYYEFTPNKVTYRVRPNGLFGKMETAQAFVAVHGKIDKLGAPATGNLKSQPDSVIQAFNKTPELIVLPTQHPRVKLTPINKEADAEIAFINNNAAGIDSIVNYNVPNFRNIKKILYDYTNKLAKASGKLDFNTWLLSSKLSDNQKNIVNMLIKAKPTEWRALWSAFLKIQEIKNQVLTELITLHGKYMDKTYGISAVINGKSGGEGYIKIMASGDMGKLVNPEFRAAPDNARYRPKLTESAVKTAVWNFARMNPPHYGHRVLIDTLKKEAEERGADWYLFVSKKQEPIKNPLSYEQKIYWLLKLFPDLEGHLVQDPEVNNLLVAATWLYNKGYRSAVFVAGEDDMPKYSETIKDGNIYGKNNPDKLSDGKAYLFEPLSFAVSPRLATATDARADAKKRDAVAFAADIFGPSLTKADPNLVHAVKTKLMNAVHYGLTHIPDAMKNKKSKVNESILVELRTLDTTKYGGWITPDKKVVYVDVWGHGDYIIDVLSDNIDQRLVDRLKANPYRFAYPRGFVRFVLSEMPQTFSISGSREALKNTYTKWITTALTAEYVKIDIQDDKGYHFALPEDKAKLIQLFKIEPTKLTELQQINELKTLDTSAYGGWIDASDGKTYYTSRNQTHHDVATALGIDMESEADYYAAYRNHFVRFVSGSYPVSFELSGNLDDLRSTYKLWYKTAIGANRVYIDIDDGAVGERYKAYNMLDPANKIKLRMDFGPAQRISESDGYSVLNHAVYGKILGKQGKAVVTDFDTADALADQYRGSSLLKIRQGRYMIKLSELS